MGRLIKKGEAFEWIEYETGEELVPFYSFEYKGNVSQIYLKENNDNLDMIFNFIDIKENIEYLTEKVVFSFCKNDILGIRKMDLFMSLDNLINIKEIEKIAYLNSIKETVFPLKTFFYVLNLLNNDKSRMKLSKRNEYKININENYAEVLFENKTVGTLEPNVGRLFFLLKKHFNFKFKAKINSFVKTDVGEIAEIIVNKDYSFNSQKKGGELFKEIKEFLIGSENYSPFVKEKLSDFFRKKENIVIRKEECKGKELTTLLLTIGIYYKITAGKKSQIVVKNNEKKCTNKFLNEYFDINYSNGEKYPFTVFYGTKIVESDSFINILL